ncbi:glycosyltransferase family 4 protein [Microcoleus sp. ZQ-A2]|nr:glycosyltransferase family 4 protein [Microcoleus sp. FACHB-1]
MKIALISYEYPPDTVEGGIASAVQQTARMLQKRGNQVEVFAGSPNRSGTETESDGVIVHRIQLKARVDFSKRIAPVFAERHAEVKFDVLEGTDFGADAAGTIQLVPDIPLVVKLHTPRAILDSIDTAFQVNWMVKAINETRVALGALRRGINPFEDVERTHALQADEIAAPTLAIAEKLIELWGLDPQKIGRVPYGYTPSAELLNIPVETHTNTVAFLGRLESRKGVLDFAKSIPLILKQCPDAKFQFVGRSSGSPDPKRDMREYIKDFLQPYVESIEFTDQVPLNQLPSIFASTDICVFPSLWDNFPFICLDAMSAGRGVVASNAGGTAEMLNTPDVGRLVSPKSPQEIAQSVVELLQDPPLRVKLGVAARQRVLEEYNVSRVGDLVEASYRRAIDRKKARGARKSSQVNTSKILVPLLITASTGVIELEFNLQNPRLGSPGDLTNEYRVQ